jgi:hypothetical protein
MSKGELALEPAGESSGSTVESKGLKGGALGLLSSVVVGMASTPLPTALPPPLASSWPAAARCCRA